MATIDAVGATRIRLRPARGMPGVHPGKLTRRNFATTIGQRPSRMSRLRFDAIDGDVDVDVIYSISARSTKKAGELIVRNFAIS